MVRGFLAARHAVAVRCRQIRICFVNGYPRDVVLTIMIAVFTAVRDAVAVRVIPGGVEEWPAAECNVVLYGWSEFKM